MEPHAPQCACARCLTVKADAMLRKAGADTLCITHTLRPKSRATKPRPMMRNAGFGRPLTTVAQSGHRVTLWGLDTSTRKRALARERVQAKRDIRRMAVPVTVAHNPHVTIVTPSLVRAMAYKPGFGG